MASPAVVLLASVGLVAAMIAAAPGAHAALGFEVQSLDGSGNNQASPAQGRAGTNYPRVAAARYADGRSLPVSGPNSRFISNRIINDVHQNVFSEHRVTQQGHVKIAQSP